MSTTRAQPQRTQCRRPPDASARVVDSLLGARHVLFRTGATRFCALASTGSASSTRRRGAPPFTPSSASAAPVRRARRAIRVYAACAARSCAASGSSVDRARPPGASWSPAVGRRRHQALSPSRRRIRLSRTRRAACNGARRSRQRSAATPRLDVPAGDRLAAAASMTRQAAAAATATGFRSRWSRAVVFRQRKARARLQRPRSMAPRACDVHAPPGASAGREPLSTGSRGQAGGGTVEWDAEIVDAWRWVAGGDHRRGALTGDAQAYCFPAPVRFCPGEPAGHAAARASRSTCACTPPLRRRRRRSSRSCLGEASQPSLHQLQGRPAPPQARSSRPARSPTTGASRRKLRDARRGARDAGERAMKAACWSGSSDRESGPSTIPRPAPDQSCARR